jgi:cytoskeletal protein CcmA (bactofilin family)
MGGRGGGAAPTPIAITNGKVNGNTINFDVVRVFAGNSVTTRYLGTVSGDTMHMKQTIDLGKGPQTVEVDAKRATP